MAEPREQRQRQQCIDLVVLGDQDRERSAWALGRRGRGDGLLDVSGFGVRAFELVLVGGHARGQRCRPHRLDQVAGEARLLERGQRVPLGRA